MVEAGHPSAAGWGSTCGRPLAPGDSVLELSHVDLLHSLLGMGSLSSSSTSHCRPFFNFFFRFLGVSCVSFLAGASLLDSFFRFLGLRVLSFSSLLFSFPSYLYYPCASCPSSLGDPSSSWHCPCLAH